MLGKRRTERMQTSSTSLEVLSQAATFVETESAGGRCEMSSSPRCFKKRAIANDIQDSCSAPAEKVRRSGNSEPKAVGKQPSTNSSDSEDDLDQPLDMSCKSWLCGMESQPQVRPSVITCAFRTQCHLKDVAEALPGSPEERAPPHEEESQPQGKDEDSSMCDPVIDEHFRRSLGKDYADLFDQNGSNSVSVTVDDHFAKALGDTWLHLQKQTTGPTEERSGSSGTAPMLPHPQGVLS